MRIKSTHHLLSLPLLVLLKCVEFIHEPFQKKTVHELPKKIGNYRLVRVLNNSWDYDTKLLGEYVDSKNKKAFCKMMFFSYKGIEYHKYKYEIKIYALIHNRKRSNLHKHVPQCILTKETSHSLLALFEYCTSAQTQGMSSSKKRDIYVKSIETISQLGEQFTAPEKSWILSRTGIDYAILYPFLLLAALLHQPKSWLTLVRGGNLYVKHITLLLGNQPLVFSHRDLHFKNILIEKKSFRIIDLESAGFTLPLYDYCISLWHEWDDTDFAMSIVKHVEKIGVNIPNFENYFKLLMIICGTHALTATNYTDKEIARIDEYLNYAITYKKAHYVS